MKPWTLVEKYGLTEKQAMYVVRLIPEGTPDRLGELPKFTSASDALEILEETTGYSCAALDYTNISDKQKLKWLRRINLAAMEAISNLLNGTSSSTGYL